MLPGGVAHAAHHLHDCPGLLHAALPGVDGQEGDEAVLVESDLMALDRREQGVEPAEPRVVRQQGAQDLCPWRGPGFCHNPEDPVDGREVPTSHAPGHQRGRRQKHATGCRFTQGTSAAAAPAGRGPSILPPNAPLLLRSPDQAPQLLLGLPRPPAAPQRDGVGGTRDGAGLARGRSAPPRPAYALQVPRQAQHPQHLGGRRGVLQEAGIARAGLSEVPGHRRGRTPRAARRQQPPQALFRPRPGGRSGARAPSRGAPAPPPARQRPGHARVACAATSTSKMKASSGLTARRRPMLRPNVFIT